MKQLDAKQVAKMKKEAEKAIARARTQLQKAQKDVAERIRKNPEQAVLISAAVGVAVGALATFNTMRKKK